MLFIRKQYLWSCELSLPCLDNGQHHHWSLTQRLGHMFLCQIHSCCDACVYLCVGNDYYSLQLTHSLPLQCDTVITGHICECISLTALELPSLTYTLGDAVKNRMPRDISRHF